MSLAELKQKRNKENNSVNYKVKKHSIIVLNKMVDKNRQMFLPKLIMSLRCMKKEKKMNKQISEV